MIQIMQAFWELLNFLSSHSTCTADFSASLSKSEHLDWDGLLALSSHRYTSTELRSSAPGLFHICLYYNKKYTTTSE